MKINIYILIIISSMIVGCNNDLVIHFYSLDKSKCITLYDKDSLRYVINGEHNRIPKSDYAVYSTSSTTELSDSFYVCWENSDYEWDVVIPKVVLLESKLDTTRYRIRTKLPIDERGIPTAIKFRGENCASFDFHRMKLIPDRGAIVEIRD